MSNHSYGVCLLCGGKGTRLLSLTNDLLPKSLVQIDGKELIKFSLEGLHSLSVSHVVFAVDYKSEMLRHWVLQQIEQLVQHAELQTIPCAVLFSQRQFKQTGGRYARVG